MMDRRTLIGAIGCSMFGLQAALAQNTGRPRQITVLSWWAAGALDIAADFEPRLAALGQAVGKDIIVTYHFANGDRARVAHLLREIEAGGADIIVCLATPTVEIAKEIVKTTPIVFQSADAIRTGIVPSLSRPGGNLTGISTSSTELSGKRLELLREILPDLTRAAFIGSALDPNGAVFAAESEAAGVKLGIRVRPFLLKGPEEFASTFETMTAERIGAAFVQPLFVQHREQLAQLSMRHRIPIIGDQRVNAQAGMLMALGTDRRAINTKLADFVDKILKGAAPADLPVEQPTTIDLVVNARTAKALSITIPPSVLVRAAEVIE